MASPGPSPGPWSDSSAFLRPSSRAPVWANTDPEPVSSLSTRSGDRNFGPLTRGGRERQRGADLCQRGNHAEGPSLLRTFSGTVSGTFSGPVSGAVSGTVDKPSSGPSLGPTPGMSTDPQQTVSTGFIQTGLVRPDPIAALLWALSERVVKDGKPRKEKRAKATKTFEGDASIRRIR